MRNKSKVLIIVTGFLLLLGGIFFLKTLVFGNYIKEVVIKEDVLINSDWTEINTENLKVEKDNQFISLLLDPKFKADSTNQAIKLPDGRTVNPEIKLIDGNGKEYAFTYSGSRRSENNEYANYKFQGEFFPDQKFEKVKLRSSNPIETQKIIWSGYNTKDLK